MCVSRGAAFRGEGTDIAKALKQVSSKNSKKACNWGGERKREGDRR